ncbi:MAG: FAD-binding protein [Lachnospirales bacterium]
MYQIKSTCSGCHTCELVCPRQAIYYNGPRYKINHEKCVECGLCDKVCPTCSVYNTEKEEKIVAHDLMIRECDVVVCGGGSGIVSAIKLAQEGKKVILLEKAKRVGGNTDMAHGFFPIYTKLHEENNVEDVREEAVEVLSKRTEGVVSEEIFETAVYGCSEFFDWLLEFEGTRDVFKLEVFGEKRTQGPLYGPAVVGFPKRIENLASKDPSIGPGWGGTFVKNTMLKAIVEQKLDVEILLEHEAYELLTKEDGSILGVLAKDKGGETKILCDNVILATGGFGSSDEKLQKYANFFDVDRYVHRFSVPSDTGDAIDMLQKLGVEPNPERMFVSMFGPAHHPYNYSLYRVLDHPSCLSVDLNGKRWQDETGGLFMGRFNIVGHPKEATWGIFTQKNIDDIIYTYLSDVTLADEYNCYESYQEDLDNEANYKEAPVVKADSIKELAFKTGLDYNTLKETVSSYNVYCAKKEDEEFKKSPEHLRPREKGPYYAIYGQRFSEAAMGGVMVNEKCEVLRNDNTVIKGLYGVGDTTSAMHRKDELAVISELTWAFASAYRSAINILNEREGK